jgi:hypothetical protein
MDALKKTQVPYTQLYGKAVVRKTWCEDCGGMVPCDEEGEVKPHGCERYADRLAIPELDFDDE